MTDISEPPKPIEQTTPDGRKVWAYPAEYLVSLWIMGRKIAPTYANGRAFNTDGLCTDEDFAQFPKCKNAIQLICLNPDFWTIDRIRKESWRFEGVRDLLGKTYVRDEQGNKTTGPYVHCKLDIDSEGAYRRWESELKNNWMCNTYVTKTLDTFGYHIDWFEDWKEDNDFVSVGHDDCKSEEGLFEIMVGLRYAQVAGRHREHPTFYYYPDGCRNLKKPAIMVRNGQYDKLLKDSSDLLDNLDDIKKHRKWQKKTRDPFHSRSQAHNSAYEANVDKQPKKVLKDWQIDSIVSWVEKFYGANGHTYYLMRSFLGALARRVEESGFKIIDKIIDDKNDFQNKSKWYRLLEDAYQDLQNGLNVEGIPKLIKAIQRNVSYDEKRASKEVDNLLQILQNGGHVAEEEETTKNESSKPNTGEQGQEKEKDLPCITVCEAIRTPNKNANVRGMIVGMAEPIQMISKRTLTCKHCNYELNTETYTPPKFIDNNTKETYHCIRCNERDRPKIEYDHTNAKKIWLQDDEPDGQLEQLTCILFERDTLNIHSGDMARVKGRVEVNRHKDTMGSVLYTQSIKYERRQELEPTPSNIESCKHFAKMPNVIDRLVSMFAPNVIWHNAEKLGTLRSLVGSPEGDGQGRGRINTLFVGPPGVAKTMILREAVDAKSGSRYVTAQNASGKGLTAIIDKEKDGSTFLRLGAATQAKGSACCINEIGRMDPEDQPFLLDIMEEGITTVDKYGMHAEIKAPTTIIATSNPIGTNWNNPLKISNAEIPVPGVLLDRFDQIYAVNEFTSEEECREYAIKKMELNKQRIQHNYNFVKMYLKCASQINPTILPEAESMLIEFWIELKKKGLATNRTFDSLYRCAKAQARLHFSNVVTEEIATEIMEDYERRMIQYGEIVKPTESLRGVTYREMVSVIKETKCLVSETQVGKIASQRNEQAKYYLGAKLDREHNKKFRNIIDMFREHPHIKVIDGKPILLEWSEEKLQTPRLDQTRDVNVKQTNIPPVTDNNVEQSPKLVEASTDVSYIVNDSSGRIVCKRSDLSDLDFDDDKTNSQQEKNKAQDEKSGSERSDILGNNLLEQSLDTLTYINEGRSQPEVSNKQKFLEKGSDVPEVKNDSQDNELGEPFSYNAGKQVEGGKTDGRLAEPDDSWIAHIPGARIFDNDGKWTRIDDNGKEVELELEEEFGNRQP